MFVKFVFSLIFIVLSILQIFFNVNVDVISIALILLIFLPWFITNLKILEIAGIGKFEIKDREKKQVEKNISEINVQDEKDLEETRIPNIYFDSDPKLLVTDIRIKIEELLNQICNKNKVIIKHDDIRSMGIQLKNKKLLSECEYSTLLKMVEILDRAVNSKLEIADVKSYNWLVNNSIKFIKSLNLKLENKSGHF